MKYKVIRRFNLWKNRSDEELEVETVLVSGLEKFEVLEWLADNYYRVYLDDALLSIKEIETGSISYWKIKADQCGTVLGFTVNGYIFLEKDEEDE